VTSSTSSDAPSTEPDAAAAPEEGRPRRQVWGRRQGPKLRPGRRTLLEERLPEVGFAIPETGRLDPRALFGGDDRPVWLEIGFGGGEHLAWQAEANPGVGLIGVEPFVNGVARLLRCWRRAAAATSAC
jgi:tRNA (guanine-N7-)-methyltransferase